MEKYLEQNQQCIDNDDAGVMETGDHFKNGANLKSLTGKKKCTGKPAGRNILFVSAMAIAVLLTCNSCITKRVFARYNNVMQEWRGQTEEHLYMVYGPPMRTQVLPGSNKKMVAYEYTENIWMQYTGSVTYRCEVVFTVENGTVIHASYSGQLGAMGGNIKRP